LVAIFAAARGIVVKRTRADWLIVAAAALIIPLATTLLSAGMIYPRTRCRPPAADRTSHL
jgi:hypothetical protein